MTDRTASRCCRFAALAALLIGVTSCDALSGCSDIHYASVFGPSDGYADGVLFVGDTMKLVGAAGRDPTDEFCPQVRYSLEAQPGRFAITMTDSSVVSVSPSGLVTALKPGTTTVFGTVESIQSQGYTIRVETPIKWVQFNAVPYYANLGDTVQVTMHALDAKFQTVDTAALSPMRWRALNSNTYGAWVPGSQSKYGGKFVVTVGGIIFVESTVRRSGYPSINASLQMDPKP